MATHLVVVVVVVFWCAFVSFRSFGLRQRHCTTAKIRSFGGVAPRGPAPFLFFPLQDTHTHPTHTLSLSLSLSLTGPLGLSLSLSLCVCVCAGGWPDLVGDLSVGVVQSRWTCPSGETCLGSSSASSTPSFPGTPTNHWPAWVRVWAVLLLLLLLFRFLVVVRFRVEYNEGELSVAGRPVSTHCPVLILLFSGCFLIAGLMLVGTQSGRPIRCLGRFLV